mmetsp:Transcript_31847/g.62206  ORF Transcript_31847/g.62206 Transcript_31847/m.62206 type:complete len:1467 (-) Transcript_31847:249-4649(-)
MEEFFIPVQASDLELEPSDNRFYVQSKLEPGYMAESQLLSLVSGVKDRLRYNSKDIIDHQNFDSLYSVTCGSKLNELNGKAVQKMTEALTHGLSNLLRSLSKVNSTSDDAKEYRNAVKMYCFLLTSIVNEMEQNVKTNLNINGKKKTARKSKDEDDNDANVWDWSNFKERVVTALLEVLETPAVFQLWPVASPEKDFGSMLFTSACTLLETKENFSRGNSDLSDAVFRIFSLCVANFDMTDRGSSSIMHLLHNFEHTPPVLANLLAVSVNGYNNGKALLVDVLREIGRLDLRIVARDNTGAKNISSFLEEVAERLPKQVLGQVSLLLPHLNGESYLIRNGVINLIGQVIEKAFEPSSASSSKSGGTKKNRKKPARRCRRTHDSDEEEEESSEEEEDEKHGGDEKEEDEERGENDKDANMTAAMVESSRLELFALLMARAHDVTSFTRAKVLQQLARLAQARALPLNHLAAVASVAADRLLDKSSQVRKCAVALLTTLLQFNPFAANLSKENFREQLQSKATVYKAKLEKRQAVQQQANATQEVKPQAAAGQMAAIAEQDGDEEDKNDEGDDDHEADGNEAAASAPALTDKAKAVAESREDEELQKDRNLLDFLYEAVQFITTLDKCVPVLTDLLGSQSCSDVLECIHFFHTANEFQLDAAPQGIREMLALIWSKEAAVVEAVIDAYRRLYIGTYDFSSVRDVQAGLAHSVARNLIGLTYAAPLSYLTSLEELMSRLMHKNQVPKPVVAALWDIFGSSAAEDEAYRIGAITLLSMLVSADPTLVVKNLPVLVSVGLGSRAHSDLRLARCTCVLLQKLTRKHIDEIAPSVKQRLEQKLTAVVCSSPTEDHAKEWFGAAEQAIATIFVLCRRPEEVCQGLLVALTHKVFANESPEHAAQSSVGNAEQLSKVFFLVGHVAIKLLLYLEQLEARAKQAKSAARAAKNKALAKQSSRQQGGSKKGQKPAAASSAIEEELAVGASEDFAVEQLREEAEVTLLSAERGRTNLLGVFGTLVTNVVANRSKYCHLQLQSSAVLAMCKLMCVSSEFCDTNLQLLFTVLTRATDPALRANVMVALGDMAYRFPNLVEPWSQHMYSCLCDKDENVRLHGLMVLIHLILNDMHKAKKPIADIAKCLTDKNKRISDLAQVFFHELSRKGKNPIYNILPDVISRLSSDADVDADAFRFILKFLMGFIQKDKQTESLVEKLCHRFNTLHMDAQSLPQDLRLAEVQEATEGTEGTEGTAQEDTSEKKAVEPLDANALIIKQCRDIAYCLSQLSYSSPAVFKKLIDHFREYKNKLGDVEVYKCFAAIVAKTRKLAKAETKELIDDFERNLKETHEKLLDEQQTAHNARNALKSGLSAIFCSDDEVEEVDEAKSPAAVKQEGKAGQFEFEAEGQEDSEDEPLSKEPAQRKRGKAAAKPKGKTAAKKAVAAKKKAPPKKAAPSRRGRRRTEPESSEDSEDLLVSESD